MANESMIPDKPPKKLETFADCMNAAKLLKNGDDAAMQNLLVAAAALRAEGKLDDIQVEMLILEIRKGTGIGIKLIKIAWNKFKVIADKEQAKKEAEERAQRNADFARARQQAADAEHERRWKSCSGIALFPELLGAMEEIAHKVLGVVNEGAAVRATYLTITSRLLARKAVRLLRTGASASGKNFPIEQTLKFFPESSVIQISGASPKSLAYEGGDDPCALMHKATYIPEAVMLGKKPGDAVNEYATMYRTLLSEGCLVYKTVVTDPTTGRRETETIIKYGPIAAVLTSADDVDQQLETRCLIQGTDESGEQTEAIVERALSDFDEDTPRDLQSWVDFQSLLEADMPLQGYRVRIPFRKEVRQAFKKWRPRFLKTANMRMRRDVDSFLVAIKASALTHKFQRETDNGAIVATIDDYRHALEAFDEGLATAHGHMSENVIAVVEAVEQMRDEAPESDLDPDPESRSVKVTVRDLANRLRIGSLETANNRLMEAVDAGAVEYDEVKSRGKGRPRWFRVLKTSAQLRDEPHGGVFPPAEVVENIFSKGGEPDEQDVHPYKKPDFGARTKI
jgi:hypothetical protein